MPHEELPPGIRLRQTLKDSLMEPCRISWSLNGRLLAVGSSEPLRIWDTTKGQPPITLPIEAVRSIHWLPDGASVLARGEIWDVAARTRISSLDNHVASWSPDGTLMAERIRDRGFRIRSLESGGPTHMVQMPDIRSLSWSPDSQFIASQTLERVDIWNRNGELVTTISAKVTSSNLAWLPDGKTLAFGNGNRVVLADAGTGRLLRFLEVNGDGASLTTWGRFIAVTDLFTISLLCCDTGKPLASIDAPTNGPYTWRDAAFHPAEPLLAVLCDNGTIRLWELNPAALLAAPSATRQYTNARVVLVGDSGVGKSGLGLVLTGQPFTATESTHGRQVWQYDQDVATLPDGRQEIRETLLWDLAGQPGYRLIHQLHLQEAAVALVVFDARNETDPFAGVQHWARALRLVERLPGALPLKKFLVAARADRGGVGVSRDRIDRLVQELGFDGYFETSAREGWQIRELDTAIRQAINWGLLPKVSSSDLFHAIKSFLVQEKEAGRLLTTPHDLYRTYLHTSGAPPDSDELRTQFETCIGLVESRGLIRRLSFGNHVLLQPERLDAYASALVNAAKDQPDGYGSIAEAAALAGDFRMPADARVTDQPAEKLLLLSTVEDMLRHEIALREQAEDGPQLLFPSQFTREWPEAPDPQGQAVIFGFEGPVLNLYASLVVRLAHSGSFLKDELWKNAARFRAARSGGACGIWLQQQDEGQAELTLFFDQKALEATRYTFEEFVRLHLERRALPGSVSRRRLYLCGNCDTPVTDLQAQRRREMGHNWIRCNVCGKRISLLDREERLRTVQETAVPRMDRSADRKREEDTAAIIIQGKEETKDFDVFLAHNSRDKKQVEAIGAQLRRRGLNPWLDKEQIAPGRWFQEVIQQAIPNVKSAAVFIGKHGLGRWQKLELKVFISQCVEAGLPVIPVLLPGVDRLPEDLYFLRELNWVRCESTRDEEALDSLEWGITGHHPRR